MWPLSPRLALLTLLAASANHSLPASAGEKLAFYIGTATSDDEGGIHYSQIDLDDGSLAPPQLATPAKRTSFIWLHPTLDVLYSVAEVEPPGEEKHPACVAWQRDPTDGTLSLLNYQHAGGSGPCFVTVRHDGRFAAVANYGSGSTTIYPLAADGRLSPASATVQHEGSGPVANRQAGPHAHSVRFDASGSRLLAADLGTDDIFVFDVSKSGELTPSRPPSLINPPGSGPRHFVFSPDNRFVLSLGELSGTISTFAFGPVDADADSAEDPTAGIEPLSTVSTMAPGTPDDANRWCAEILFHPSLPVVYCSNRGPHEMAIFDYDPGSGQLIRRSGLPCGGKTPRNFRLTPDGNFLLVANQDSDNIAVFRVDPRNGDLEPTGHSITVAKPMCIKFVH